MNDEAGLQPADETSSRAPRVLAVYGFCCVSSQPARSIDMPTGR